MTAMETQMFTRQELDTAVAELSRYAASGRSDWQSFGRIKAEYQGDLVILNYTQQAMFANEWTVYECVCRGLILNRSTGAIAARAFDKFFNWGQGDRKTNARIAGVTEKMDGSLGVSYRDGDGEFRIATRGSFVSDQAVFATEFASKNLNSRGVIGWTLLFEIIYPENRIVIDYGDFRGLVLLAARNIRTGDYAPRGILKEVAGEIGCPLVVSHPVDSIDDLLSLTSKLDATKEGFVAEFSDGSRFKFKGEQYCSLAKAIQGLTFKNVLAAMQAGTFDDLMNTIPDEFCDEARQWEYSVRDWVEKVAARTESVFVDAPKDSRKDFAIWARDNHPELMSYLFAKLDGKDMLQFALCRADRDMPQKPVEHVASVD